MTKRVTIKDVAKAAGVSVTTTSYVLNNNPKARISAKTAERVRKVAQRLQYVPRSSARTLINRQSNLIGVIIPQTGSRNTLMFSNPFYGEFLSAVEYAVRQQGYHLLLSGTGPNQDYSQVAQMRELDGIIILGPYPSDFLDEIKETMIPTVLVDAYVDDYHFPTVGNDDRYGGYLATKYLIDKGHSKIAFVSEPLREKGVHEQRFRGYADALQEGAIPIREEYLYTCEVTYDCCFRLAPEIIKRNNKETAVFVVADVMAMGLINGLTARGVAIPDDISIIGFDDVPLATMCLPSITTVRQDITAKGTMAAQAVMESLRGSSQGNVLLPLELVERDSVQDLRIGKGVV